VEDDDRVTPARVFRETGQWTPAVLFAVLMGVLVITAGILIPGWFIGGWFQSHSIARNYGNTVNSQSYQSALVAEMEQHVTNITGPGGLAAQRQSVPAGSPEQANMRASELNEITSLCSESATFQPQLGAPGAAQMQAVVQANCLAGTPVADPPLANPVPVGGQ
jgi:hypothetical protein